MSDQQPAGPDEWVCADESDYEAECPHCRKTFGDLLDYKWGDEDAIEIDCPHCDKPLILIAAREKVTYYTKHIKKPATDAAGALRGEG